LPSEDSVVQQHTEILSKLIAVGLADTCSQVLPFKFVCLNWQLTIPAAWRLPVSVFLQYLYLLV